ncbi:pyridoxamine 5'-phosphate oxidase [Aureimonas endophytica]|uniref:Pyridoxamine 5'-phosphate oxidase n=1 Tax=Aureimonas endophytica TaxID=2027858 RepID=A0A917DZW9_9HYPH|nr:pyridoxamine 5'-phosphate oxidase family protein [Aureimonas endophytica]GGD85466.1 pyridoxamine 5'-phosphate oxidase [Aureimonas endophytica]
MAKQFGELSDAHREFIARQHVFFTASSTPESRVNISPRETLSLRVLGPKQVAFRDLTGSGCETAAHCLADGRLTIMFCAFEGQPLIMRLYGRGTTHRVGTTSFDKLLQDHFGAEAPLGTRQIVLLDIDLVQTSCGYGVPLFDYVGERPNLARWAEHKGEAGLVAYRAEKNVESLDGLPTGFAAEPA